MKLISGKQLVKIVQAHGWSLARVNGSHHIFKHADKTGPLVIPVHGNETLKIGLLRALMKTADLKESDL
ncbi:type II toxin-antitoxin system HicA family toxin [Prosthecobacter dejongeii]|uniref:Putative RNA binding protein YcfA (HicA-like mRNA interferase family) n=1 Tax=Prosthecobacter dejongeii TaxID=48465 RepID=A0A7W8DQ10_9BACT|nr:putative RNA binding protein YcfA (HicA-like mRNA interferase family) [Prosthecobacter dejongeii]